MDKKQIALTVAGIIAGLTLTYLLWKQSQASSQQTIVQTPDNYTAGGGSELYNLPAITVPDLTTTFGNTNSPSSSDSALQDQLNALQQQLQDALNSATNGTAGNGTSQNHGTAPPPTDTTSTPPTQTFDQTPITYMPPIVLPNDNSGDIPAYNISDINSGYTAPVQLPTVTANPPGNYVPPQPAGGSVVTGTEPPPTNFTPITIIRNDNPGGIHSIAVTGTADTSSSIPSPISGPVPIAPPPSGGTFHSSINRLPGHQGQQTVS